MYVRTYTQYKKLLAGIINSLRGKEWSQLAKDKTYKLCKKKWLINLSLEKVNAH
jgi:hypothetical protein